MRTLLPFASLATAVFAGCGTEPVTFQADVRPVVEQRCVTCHTDGGIGPMVLDDPASVEMWKEAIVGAVEARTMPPWGMDPNCRDIKDSQALTDDTIALFTQWADGGFEMGDEADYVAPEVPAVEPLPDPDLTLDFGAAYLPDDTKTDDYRCVAVGDPLAADLYVRGMHVRPDRDDLVHHVLLYAVPPDGIAEIERRAQEDDAPGFACFGDTGVGTSQTIGGWAPGGVANLWPEDTAMRVSRGSQLLVQMHYNTAAADVEDDRTQVDVWTLPDGVQPDWLINTHPIAFTTLDIPAGAEDSVQEREQRIPVSGQVVGVSPHMHTRGRTLSTTLKRADGTEECLSRINDYDFDWQRNYRFEDTARVDVSVHDTIEIRCTYDNSDNDDRVTWGDGTADEMCLDYVSVVRANTLPAESDGVCAGADSCVQDCPEDDPWCPMTCMSTDGEACLYCGIDQMFDFGGCLADACQSEMTAYGLCVQSCMDGFEDFFECSYSTCGANFTPYWQCATEQLKGECSGLLTERCNE